MRSRIIAIAGALVFLAAAAACDSDDDGSTGEEGALTRSEFGQQADKICADFEENGGLEVNERLIGRVDDLVPPDSEQDTITQLLDHWREYFDEQSQPAEARSPVAFSANDIARQLGLKCIIATP